jgi:hypothetical protein
VLRPVRSKCAGVWILDGVPCILKHISSVHFSIPTCVGPSRTQILLKLGTVCTYCSFFELFVGATQSSSCYYNFKFKNQTLKTAVKCCCVISIFIVVINFEFLVLIRMVPKTRQHYIDNVLKNDQRYYGDIKT